MSHSSLTGFNLVHVGLHKSCPDFAGLSLDELKKSVADHGGILATRITKDTTHLIADAKSFAAKGAKVQQATKHDLKIVSYDWLVKSLASKKKIDESTYFLDDEMDTASDDLTQQTSQCFVGRKRKRGRDSSEDGEAAGEHDAPSGKFKLKVGTPEPVDAKPPVKATVDEESGLQGTTTVYQDNDSAIYDVTLNQTNAANNSNKFYRLQLLLSPHETNSHVWTRWGRVGERGQTKLFNLGDLAESSKLFEKKFREKTGLKWADRHETPKPGKYTVIERSYDSSEDDDKKVDGTKTEEPISARKRRSPKKEILTVTVESTLPAEVQDLVSFIFNTDIFNATMTVMDYDAHRMPLGKLSQRTLIQGLEILRDIASLIGDNTLATTKYELTLNQAYESLSNRYFSTVPHAFGRARPPVIQTQTLMKKELDLIESLTDMQVTNDIMKTARGDHKEQEMHILDRQFAGLNLREMDPLARGTPEFVHIEEYLIKSSASTHNIEYNVESIFRIERHGESDRFQNMPYKNFTSDRRLLWHGSRSTNYGGILSQGLRIAPPEAPASGFMFARGLYFADLSTKSSNYCWANSSKGVGLLLLCEVELGDPSLMLYSSDYNADDTAKANGCISTFGVGRVGPKKWKDASCIHEGLKGVRIPDLTELPATSPGIQQYFLQYNEYIVYDLSQVRLRYLLRVKM